MPHPKTPKPLEKEIQRNGIKLLKFLGWTCHRRNTGMTRATYGGRTRVIRYGEPGMADIFGKLPDGRSFELEFKRPGNRPTRRQFDWLKSQNSEHCVAFWVDDVQTLEIIAKRLMRGFRIWWDDDDDDVFSVGLSVPLR